MRKILELDCMTLASEITRASDETVWDIFSALRRERRLSLFVSDMNARLRSGTEREAALSALRRFGLEHSG